MYHSVTTTRLETGGRILVSTGFSGINLAIAMHAPTKSKIGDRQRRIFNEKGTQISLDEYDKTEDIIEYKPKNVQMKLYDY